MIKIFNKQIYDNMFNTLNTFTDDKKEYGRDAIMVWGAGESRALLNPKGLSLVDANGVSGTVSVEDFSISVEIATMDCLLGGFEFNKHNGDSCVSAVKEITEYTNLVHNDDTITLCLAGGGILETGIGRKNKFANAKLDLEKYEFRVINPLDNPLFNSYSRSEHLRIIMQDMCQSDGVAIVSDDHDIPDLEKEIAAKLCITSRTVEEWISWKSK